MSEIKYTDALSLSGPRTYFTLLDNNNLRAYSDHEKYFSEVEDALKVFLLTKDKIVIAASHLASNEAFHFFEGKERLFEEGIVLPALRSEFSSFEEMYASKYSDLDSAIPKFFGSNIKEVIPWDLKANSGWFHDRIKEEYQNPNSVFRNYLRTEGHESSFLNIIEKHLSNAEKKDSYFSREKLTEDIESHFPDNIVVGINQWIDLLYYISGSRVVRCENFVPQENLISYNLATMSTGRHILSESEIFHSIVIMLVLNSFYSHAYPVNIIKNLSISDILNLRNENSERSAAFRKKYEECLAICETERTANEKESLLKNLSELRGLAEDVKNSFSENIIIESASYKSLVNSKTASNKILDLFVNFIGIFALPVSVINFIFNNCQLKDIGKAKKLRKEFSKYHYNAIRSVIKRKYRNDPLLLEYIEDIIRLHKERYLVQK